MRLWKLGGGVVAIVVTAIALKIAFICGLIYFAMWAWDHFNG